MGAFWGRWLRLRNGLLRLHLLAWKMDALSEVTADGTIEMDTLMTDMRCNLPRAHDRPFSLPSTLIASVASILQTFMGQK